MGPIRILRRFEAKNGLRYWLRRIRVESWRAVAFCLQLLVSEISALGANRPLDEDLEQTVCNLTAHLKQLGSLLGGAEKILLDAAALREQLARESRKAA